MRKLVLVLVVLLLIGAGVYVFAGRAEGPAVQLVKPEKLVGVSTPLEVSIDAPDGRVHSVRITLEQNGVTSEIAAGEPASWVMDGPTRRRITGEISRQSLPSLKSGPARITVTATRPVLFGFRQAGTAVSRDVQVRLERPQLSVLSTHHYINQGGSEMIVYRVSPGDVASGVTVGEREYPGYPASGLGIPGMTVSDPAVRVAFFALLHDQDPATPMHLFARDEAGNAATAAFESRTFPKRFKASRIELNDDFLHRVVPTILAGTTEIAPNGTTIDQFVAINRTLRQRNAETIAAYAAKTSAELLWGGTVFHTFVNNAVESAFADRRTYFYQGNEVDRQVHLGFDLASVVHAPVVAAHRGTVLFAGELGIYGQAVILDHGMGVQSLYAHLSQIDVAAGVTVDKSQILGKSGITGMAGGDHLHFTMLVHGQMVNPVEWWDAHWIEDRILRKIRDAAGISSGSR
jgi:murein DD-endopeptidase MepM/ murein hydrolase activator NlpD